MSKISVLAALANIFIISLSLLHFATAAQSMYALEKWQHIPFHRIQTFYNFMFQCLITMYYFVAIYSVIVALYSLLTPFIFDKGIKLLSVDFYLNLFSFSFQFLLGVASAINLTLFQQNLHILIYLVNFWNTLQNLFLCQTFITFAVSMPIMVIILYTQWQNLCQVVKSQQNQLQIKISQTKTKIMVVSQKSLENKLSLCEIPVYKQLEGSLGVNYPQRTKFVCLSILLIDSAMHIAFGIELLTAGYSQYLAQQNEKLYYNSIPLCTFSIATGVYLILAISFFIYVLTKQSHFSKSVEQISWHMAWSIFVLNFGAGVMEISQYLTTLQIYTCFQLSISQQPSIFQMQYYLSIVDGSLTLLLGLPASFIFMHYANCRLIAVEIKQRIKIISECSSYSDYLPLDRSTIGKEYIDDPQAKSFRNYSNEVSWTKLMITSNNQF